MQKIKAFFWVLVLLTPAMLKGQVQGIVLHVDSIVEAGTAHYNTEIPITNNDSVTVIAHLINRDSSILPVFPPFLDFQFTYKGITLDSNQFYWSAVPETLGVLEMLAPGDSVPVRFSIYNFNNDPLPDISPGGGSVVIWPIYNGQPTPQDSIMFTLIYSDPGYSSKLIYTHNNLNITLGTPEERFYELYDMLGHRLFMVENDNLITNFDLSAYAVGVYVLRIRQGSGNQAFKFSKY